MSEAVEIKQDVLLQAVIRRLAAKARRLGSTDDEAAAQEAISRALQNPHAAEAFRFYFGSSGPTPEQMPGWSPGRLEAWLSVTVRFVVNEQRRVKACGAQIDLPSNDPDTLESLIHGEQRQLFEGCLGCLKEGERRALLLYHDGWKYTEIAREMRTSENSVASWIKRGRERLLQCVRRAALRCKAHREEGDPDARPGRRAG